ncbi:MAG: hypothetical protein MZV63_13705 [Marinilabiliales bacterium]|nr:hypothetical protein [Marinilabiliales bacterium]
MDHTRERQPPTALPRDRGPRPGPRPDDGPAPGRGDRPLEGRRGAGRSGGRRRRRHLGAHGPPRPFGLGCSSRRIADHALRRQQHGADPRMPEPELRRPDHRPPEPGGRHGRHDLYPRPDPERAEKPRRAEDFHARQLRGPRGRRLDGRFRRGLPEAARLRPGPLPPRPVRSRGPGPRDRRALPLRLPEDRQRPDHREPFPHGPGPAEQARGAPPGRSGTRRVCPRGRPESAGLGRYPDGGVLEPRAVLGGQGGRQRGAHLRPAHRRRRDPDRLAELAGRAGGVQTAVRHRPVRRAEPSHLPYLHPQSARRGPARLRLSRRRALQRQRHLVGPGRTADRVHVPLRLPSPAGPLRSRRRLLLRRTRRRTSCPRGGSIPISSPSIRTRPACTAANPGRSRPPRSTGDTTTTTSIPKSSWRGCGSRAGRIVLPDGLSYALLVLPDRDDMPLEVLRKLGELVEAGATVVGRKPVRAPGLAGFPACDGEVKALADGIWGACDGAAVKERALGKGRIVWGIPLERYPARSRAGARLPGARRPQRRSAYRFHPSIRRPRRPLLRLQQRQGDGSLRRGLPGGGGQDARVLVSRHGQDRPLPFVRPGRGRLPADDGAPGLRLRLRRLSPDADAGGLSFSRSP